MDNIICDLYIRVSTQEQAQEGYSIGEQEARLRKYAEAHGWIIHQCHIDAGFSGAKLERPAIQQVIKDAEKHLINKVLVYRLDRLSRSQKDTLYLIEEVFIKNGVDFVSMTETLDTGTPFGIAMIGILSVFAQLERETIRERLTIGRDARIKSGKYRGGGFEVIGFHYNPETHELTIDDYEAMVVRTMYQLYLEGVTASGIANKLNLDYKFRACTWTAHKVLKILQQPLYIGLQRWKGELMQVENCPIIINPETWQAVQKEIARKTSKAPKAQSPHNHTTLLGGLLWCGKCGHRYAGCSDKDAKGNRIHRYYCYQRLRYNHHRSLETCTNKSWRADELNAIILDEIRKLSLNRDKSTGSNLQLVYSDEIKGINTRLAELEAQEDKLIELYSIGKLSAEMIAKRADTIKAERLTLQAKLEQIKSPTGTLGTSEAVNILNTFDELIEASDASTGHMELYNIVHQLIQSVTVTDDTVNIIWNFEI